MSLPLIYECKKGTPIQVKRVDIGLFDPETIRKISVVKVTESAIYEKNLPKRNGPNDHRLGVVDRRLSCGTCGNSVNECNGHIGHIELAYPMYHIAYMVTVLKILRCVCFYCAELKFDPTEPKFANIIANKNKKNRLSSLVEKAKVKKKCMHCEGRQPQYKKMKRNPLAIEIDWNGVEFESKEEETFAKKPFNSRTALNILKHVSDETYQVLGFNPKISNPKWMVMEIMVVPPPTIRPSIMESEGSRTRGQDDLTQKLKEIVNANNVIENFYIKRAKDKNIDINDLDKSTIEVPENLLYELQKHIATYVDNDIRGMKPSVQRSGAPTRSIKSRLKGKETNRMRGNLMGKRVDFSSRAVITPDPKMDVDEIGVPIHIAMTLTYPEGVTYLNIDELTKCVRNGPNCYPGANTVITGDGSIIYLDETSTRQDITLQIGWKVERHMKNGDVVVFNRQPSLHKQSMMGHRVKVMPFKTFRLSLPCTVAYNADFDGDEMNLHFPQSESAKADVDAIMSLPNQIVSPQANKPVIGLVQDVLVGSFLFTRKNTFLTREKVMDLIMQIKYDTPEKEIDSRFTLPPPTIWKPQQLWTGKQIFSLLIPGNLHLTKKVRNINDQGELCLDREERFVAITNGELLIGSLCKQTLGTSSGSLVHILFNDYGPLKCNHFLSDVQRMINQWLMVRGLSVGIEDCMTTLAVKQRILECTDRAEKVIAQAHKYIKETGRKRKVSDIDSTNTGAPLKRRKLKSVINEDEIEMYASTITNKILDQAGRIVQEYTTVDNCSIHAMGVCGSKGNAFNLTQMKVCVGQQSNEGKRIKPENGTRTLPCYKHNELAPPLESNGFVKHSFEEGLTPQESFMHTIGAREGLVDTAVKSVTGDTQLILVQDSQLMLITIGEWIDRHLDGHCKLVTKYGPENANMELLDLSPFHNVYIPSTDSQGAMRWRKVTNVTRHDPGDYIYTIKTKLGREVAVVASKSLLIWDENKQSYQPKDTRDVKVGDFVPVCAYLPSHLLTVPPINMKDYSAKLHNSTTRVVFDRDSGYFIGTGIANGIIDFETNTITMTHVNTKILEKTKVWLNHYDFGYQAHETSALSIVTITSPVLVTFFSEWINQDAESQCFLLRFYSACDAFIQGLIDALFLSKSVIVENTLQISFASVDLLYALDMLLTRFGIGTQILSLTQHVEKNITKTMPTMCIPLAFMDKFANTFPMTAQQKCLYDLLARSVSNQPTDSIRLQKDTILDEIVSIEKCVADQYPKVYDMTIPDTETFGLANGLQVYDTSQTGYTQRQNVKAMESLHVSQNGLVKNAKGEIVEFAYGMDGVDATYMERVQCEFILHSNNQIVEKLSWQSNDFDQDKVDQIVEQEVEALIACRDKARAMKSSLINLTVDSDLFVMVNLKRLSTRICKSQSKDSTIVDPELLFDTVNRLCQTIEHASFIKSKDGTLQVKSKGTIALQLHMRSELTSKRLCLMLKCSKKSLKEIVQQVGKLYHMRMAPNGEMVGALAAQSLGEPSTQMTLNTFHYAGIVKKNVTLGVPRLKELVNATKKMKKPSATVYLKAPFNQSKEGATVVKKILEHVILADVVESPIVVKESDFAPTQQSLTAFDFPLENEEKFATALAYFFDSRNFSPELSTWTIRYGLNKSFLISRSLTPQDIASKVEEYIGTNGLVHVSEYNMSKWFIRIRLFSVKEMMERIPPSALGNSGSLEDTEHSFLNKVQSRFLEDIHISGIPGITKAHPAEVSRSEFDKNTGVHQIRKEWILETEGTALAKILSLPPVNPYKTYSNDIHEVASVLGIDAAATILYKELKDVISFDGTYINDRHFTMAVNTMTFRGHLVAMSRHGINRIDTGFLVRSSFEETAEILFDAAGFAETNQANGVTESIILGQLAPIGTNMSAVLLDREYKQHWDIDKDVNDKESNKHIVKTVVTHKASSINHTIGHGQILKKNIKERNTESENDDTWSCKSIDDENVDPIDLLLNEESHFVEDINMEDFVQSHVEVSKPMYQPVTSSEYGLASGFDTYAPSSPVIDDCNQQHTRVSQTFPGRTEQNTNDRRTFSNTDHLYNYAPSSPRLTHLDANNNNNFDELYGSQTSMMVHSMPVTRQAMPSEFISENMQVDQME